MLKGHGQIVLSRAELYQRVWSMPVLRLAQEFGVSDVALAKACRRRNVPLPPRGYWARRAVGQSVLPTALPPPLPAHDRPVVFRSKPSVTAPQPRARAEVKPPIKSAPAAPSLHPVADRVRKALLLSKPHACGRVRIQDTGLPHIVASPRQASQVAYFVDSLIAEARRKQIDVAVAPGTTRPLEFRRGKQSVQFYIEEELRARPGRDLSPSGRLTFQLAVQLKQAADTPAEDILGNLVTWMDGILR